MWNIAFLNRYLNLYHFVTHDDRRCFVKYRHCSVLYGNVSRNEYDEWGLIQTWGKSSLLPPLPVFMSASLSFEYAWLY